MLILAVLDVYTDLLFVLQPKVRLLMQHHPRALNQDVVDARRGV